MGALPLSLLVFAYDEEANVAVAVGQILAWLRSRGGPYELVFVDDGSRDGTLGAARAAVAGDPGCKIVSHDRNRGIGAAIKTGVRAATLPWVSFLPCDGQIPPAELDLLCAAAERERVRLVFSTYRAREDGLHRKVLSAGIRALIWSLFGVHMRSDGPYLFARELFDPALYESDTFFLNFEFPIRMLRSHERHGTVTIECVPRISGSSKSTQLGRILGVARDLVDLRLRI
ncbi:MAG: glycosyltransferase family 2 protein [Deltaproteobacteria bacterium]|nr:glycosyltransferase family 2 protein [Deltaproteobacteria bacterium]